MKRLSVEPWTSPPLFDHELVTRLVELGLVESAPLLSGEIEYGMTEAGRAPSLWVIVRNRSQIQATFRIRSVFRCPDHATGAVGATRASLSNVIDKLTPEGNEMVAAPRDLPATGYAIEVDGRLKAEFETEDGARAAAQELKRRFPMVRVRIYDTRAQAREEIQLSRN